jgi:hypothetical protein
VVWESSNDAVATVSASGLVEATGAGSAAITVTAADGSGKSATCAVTVSEADARIELQYCTTAAHSTPTIGGVQLSQFNVTLRTFTTASRPTGTSSCSIGLNIFTELSADKTIAPGVYEFVTSTAGRAKNKVMQASMGWYDDNGTMIRPGTISTASTLTVTKDGDEYTLLIDIAYTNGNVSTFKASYTGQLTFP